VLCGSGLRAELLRSGALLRPEVPPPLLPEAPVPPLLQAVLQALLRSGL
jgi:hypothetical protein